MNHNLYIVWDDSKNFGIPIIDEQHRGLITTINSLYYCIKEGQGNDIIKSILIMLGQYAKIHFKTEESLMEEAGYPEIKEHLIFHETFIKKSKSLYSNVDNDSVTDEVLQFLRMWWLNHINKEDIKYIKSVKKLLD